MYPLKFENLYYDKVWGGRGFESFRSNVPKGKIGESWDIACHPNGTGVVANGRLKGVGFKELIKFYNKEIFGNRIVNGEFPLLVKLINSNENLSVQVHPNDSYANLHENDNGKTECWYILEAKEGASLICGLKSGLDKEQLAQIIADNKIEDYLESVSVKEGDMIYIPAGTVHAIQGGIKLLEVQQSSDVTYRMYDWGRDREMHIEKSLEVIDYTGANAGGKIENFIKLETPYFNVEKITVNGSYENEVADEFQTITVTKGTGSIVEGNHSIELNIEDTVYISKGVSYCIKGELELIRTY